MKTKHLIFSMLILLLFLSRCLNVSQTDYYNVQNELSRAQNQIGNQEQEISELTDIKTALEKQVSGLEEQLETLSSQLDTLQTEYNLYKDKMAEYEDLATTRVSNDNPLDIFPGANYEIPSLPSGNEYKQNAEFRQCLAEALAELGSSLEINGIDIYIEDELDGDITLIVYVDTDVRPIAVDIHYLGLVDSWIYSIIRDANLDHIYYPALYKTHDFYTDLSINN